MTLGAAWTGAGLLSQSMLRAAQARAQATGVAASLFHVEKVTEGVYAALAKPALFGNCNAAIFENASDLLIVDSHSKPSAVVALVAQLRAEVSKKPVRYIVNSHFHWDHSHGNPAYRRMAPDGHIVSSEVTRKLLADRGAKSVEGQLEQARKGVETYRQQAAAAKTPEEKARLQGLAKEAQAFWKEMQDWKPELPDLTFDRDLIIRDKAHDLHLAFRGRGHTAGDVVVWCPQKKAIATGDLLHSLTPYCGDGYPKEWPKTLRAVAEFDYTHVAGGHGPVQHSKERAAQKAGFIEEVTERIAEAAAQGLAAEQMRTRITPASLKSLQGDYGGWLRENFRLAGRATAGQDPLAGPLAGMLPQIAARLNPAD